ncbi:MAG: DNA methyltransferase [Nitrospiraceae bacterium]
MINTIIRGDCIEAMATLPANSVDLAVTDPPYLVKYRSRDGRRIANDGNDAWLEPAFARLYRVMKPDSYAVSFYGYDKADLFIAAWKKAGFRIVGHIVFPKDYASSTGHTQRRHEQAYLLAKGRPLPPANPAPDVIRWTTYTGNRLHPTQKPIDILTPLITAFSRPGDLVLDPFAGSGSTLVAARKAGRNFTGIELDRGHFRTAAGRLFPHTRMG